MAATVVSVVIFLCGVLVGRGVRAERGSGTEATAMNDSPADITPTQPPPPVPPPAGSDPTAAAPPPPAEDLSYPKRLEQTKQPAEELKPATSKVTAAPASAPAKTANATKVPAAPSAANDRGAPPLTAAADAQPPAGQDTSRG